MSISRKSSTFALAMVKNNDFFVPIWELDPRWEVLSNTERIWLRQHLVVEHYNKNEIIHTDGVPAAHMWILLSGKVRVYKEGVGQRQQILRLLKPYDIFGYRAVVANECYTTNASAVEPCVVYRLDKDCFTQLIQQNGAFCYHILRSMSTDLKVSEVRTVNLTQKHIRGRLAEALMDLRLQYGYEEDGQTLALLLPREDLANMSNMTTSNAIRTLSQFAQEGLIALTGKHVKILNEKDLERVSRLG